jgi:dipeptidyl-peptidase-4
LWHFRDSTWRQLTKGAWVVSKLVSVDERRGKVYFLANRDDPLAMQIHALDLQHSDRIETLGEPGWDHAASMDKAGKTLLVTRSSPAQPPQVYIADTSGKRLAWVEENRLGGSHPYAAYANGHRQPTFGTIKAADGTDLHWKMILPELRPGKRYPVFFQHYGGPHVQTVTRGWAGALEQAIVAKGFIFFEIDNRGSANRGVAYESAIWRAMGGAEVADQKAGALYLKSLPFVDGDKIATYGWSYGGYMTLKMLEADQGLYAAGIAGAPVTKWELYDTHYTERYLGDPRRDPQVYAKSDALADAPNIRDPLLLIHGMADDNVVFENSSALIARLQGEAVPFEMMLYPGYTHRVGGPKVGQHLWETIFAFLSRHGVTPPQ